MKRLTEMRRFQLSRELADAKGNICHALEHVCNLPVKPGGYASLHKFHRQEVTLQINAAIRRLVDVRSTIANLKP